MAPAKPCATATAMRITCAGSRLFSGFDMQVFAIRAGTGVPAGSRHPRSGWRLDHGDRRAILPIGTSRDCGTICSSGN
jgi:hypothetical protein